MKRKKLSYDSWTRIERKRFSCRHIDSETFSGHVALVDIEKVTAPQVWSFQGKDTVVCDRGVKWLVLLPDSDFFCITAMLGPSGDIRLWYVDMIASRGISGDGIPYFDDLYLDLIVYPEGMIREDDRDELEEAFRAGDISEEQYRLALDTEERLLNGLLKDLPALTGITGGMYDLIRKDTDTPV